MYVYIKKKVFVYTKSKTLYCSNRVIKSELFKKIKLKKLDTGNILISIWHKCKTSKQIKTKQGHC